MDRLFSHVDAITRQRNRGELEASLVSALRDLLGAEAARLFKLFSLPGDLLVGLASEATTVRTRILDDGIAWPDGTGSLERFPMLNACLAQGKRITEHDRASDLHYAVFPIVVSNHGPFGFIEITTRAAFDSGQIDMIEGMVTLFRNCVAMLDYTETDTLTSLLNRKTFDEYLIAILSHVANDDSSSGSLHLPRRRHMHANANHHWLGVIDIDHFKAINDNFGHLIGDEVLILIANLMKTTFRAQDRLFRFGGEEFVVLLMPAELAHASATFERYRDEIASFNFPQVGHVTISAGFTRIGLYDTPSMILDNADEALYYAKEHGRNQVHCYEELIDSGKLVRHETMRSDVEIF